ncbi:MAG: biotin/lipoyl-binding protein [Burkholderiaceae bacterium]|nr:biotin/lipoyl-binding protein [Burkholderiaceae bacterium]
MLIKFPERRSALLLPAVAVLTVCVVVGGVLTRGLQAEELRARAAAQAVPIVALVAPDAVAAAPLELPACIEPWAWARVSGYLQHRNVDIGAAVKAGQVLAQLDTPELDQQIRQAQAELATARSQLALAASTAQRWQALLEAKAVSQQGADEKAGDFAARQSVVQAMDANVAR